MNNNQFKKVVRQFIEDECDNRQFKVYYIDLNSNKRIAYVYNKDFQIQTTIELWFSDKEVSIEYSLNKTRLVSLVNYDGKSTLSYMELDKIRIHISNIFYCIDNLTEK